MKKYLLGFSAIVFAIAFSAFTKPVAKLDFKDFKFDEVTSPTSANVSNPANWQSSVSITCPNSSTLTQACKIASVSETYYHLVSGSTYKLNDQAFINTNRVGTVDENDQVMSITASDGTITSDGEFLVSAVSQGTITNKDDN